MRGQGPNLFYKSVEARIRCCHVRKVEPMRRALDGLAAWITGLRRDQSASRAAVNKVELDAEHGGLLKLNPLCDWTAAQVWDISSPRRAQPPAVSAGLYQYWLCPLHAADATR